MSEDIVAELRAWADVIDGIADHDSVPLVMLNGQVHRDAATTIEQLRIQVGYLETALRERS